MKYKKLLIQHWFKEYEVIEVTKDCFNNSLNIESCGSMEGIKIYSLEDLNFRIEELKRLKYQELNKELLKGGNN